MFKSRIFTLFVLSTACIYSGNAVGQINEDGSSFGYKKDFEYGGFAHTAGVGLNLRYSKHKSREKNILYDLDWVVSMKNFREFNTNGDPPRSRSYIVGKLNEFSLIRFTYGRQKIIADFQQPLGVKVCAHYSIGPNIGFIKPVYIKVYTDQPDVLEVVLYDPVRFNLPGMINGGASKWTGLGETKLIPGISTKLSMSYQWGKEDNKYKCLETGIMIDLYPKQIPIMAYVEKNPSVFFNVYLAFTFGKRW